MSAIQISLHNGSAFYTKDYPTVEEVDAAIKRHESLKVFWYVSWGKRFQETLLVNADEVAHLVTEREIP